MGVIIITKLKENEAQKGVRIWTQAVLLKVPPRIALSSLAFAQISSS